MSLGICLRCFSHRRCLRVGREPHLIDGRSQSDARWIKGRHRGAAARSIPAYLNEIVIGLLRREPKRLARNGIGSEPKCRAICCDDVYKMAISGNVQNGAGRTVPARRVISRSSNMRVDGSLPITEEIVSRLRAITPAVMEPGTRYRNPELRQLFLSGLRLAAGEEG
jgi:hypothetical protein